MKLEDTMRNKSLYVVKKLAIIAFCLVICLMSLTPALAATQHRNIDDRRNVLGDYQEDLNNKAYSVYQKYGFNISVIIASPKTGENLNQYAEEYYRTNFGNEDGIAFVENGSECGFYTEGTGKTIFTEEKLNALLNAYNGESDYISKVFQFLEQAEMIIYASGVYVNGNDEAHPPRVVDDGDLLSSSEETELTKKLDYISKGQGCDVIVVTADSLGSKTAQEFADDYFDYMGYGIGPQDSGILLLVCMEERDYAFSTYGFGITAFNDKGIDLLEEEVVPYLSDENFYDAFSQYGELCQELLIRANEGEPYGTGGNGEDYTTGEMLAMGIPGAVALGTAGSGIATLSKKARLKTVRRRYGAEDYVVSGSMAVDRSNDYFLYSQITQRAKPKDNNSGGSTLHRSSSGRMHGGGSGKF